MTSTTNPGFVCPNVVTIWFNRSLLAACVISASVLAAEGYLIYAGSLIVASIWCFVALARVTMVVRSTDKSHLRITTIHFIIIHRSRSLLLSEISSVSMVESSGSDWITLYLEVFTDAGLQSIIIADGLTYNGAEYYMEKLIQVLTDQDLIFEEVEEVRAYEGQASWTHAWIRRRMGRKKSEGRELDGILIKA